jgi:hypothetical protein
VIRLHHLALPLPTVRAIKGCGIPSRSLAGGSPRGVAELDGSASLLCRCHVPLRVGSPRSVVPALPLSCGPKCTRSARDTPRRYLWRVGGVESTTEENNGNQGSSILAPLSPSASRPQRGLRSMATCADCAHAFDRCLDGRCALAASAVAWRGVITASRDTAW